jgi:hypothetical protein
MASDERLPPEFIPVTEMPQSADADKSIKSYYTQCIAANVSQYVYTPNMNDFDVIMGKYREYIYSEPGNNLPQLRSLKETIYYYAIQNVLLDFIERLKTEGSMKYDVVLRGTYGLRNLPEMSSKRHLLPTSDVDIVIYPKEGVSDYDAHEHFIQSANYIFSMYCKLINNHSINSYISYIYEKLKVFYHARFSGNMSNFREFGVEIGRILGINKMISVSKPDRSPIPNLYKFVVREIVSKAHVYNYALMDIVVKGSGEMRQETKNVDIYVSPTLTTKQKVPTLDEYIKEKKELYCDLGCSSGSITNPSYCSGYDVATYKKNADDWRKDFLCNKFEKQLVVIDEENIGIQTTGGGKKRRTRRTRKAKQKKISKRRKSKTHKTHKSKK